jgi:hypothetical protein
MKTKKVGRPSKENKLTSAQKQSNYRRRCASRVSDMGKSVSFEYDVFNEIKIAIAQVENRYPLRAGVLLIERKAAIYALEELRRVLINKSNVIKIKYPENNENNEN